MAPRQMDLSNYASVASLASLPQYINNGAFQTVAQLKANYPAGSDTLGKLGRVSDLWGSVKTTMICEQDENGYYWRPQRTDYASPSVATTQTSGTFNFIPLVTPPIVFLNNTLVGALTVALGVADVWPGCKAEINAPSSLGLFGLTLTGLVGGLTASLLGGSRKEATYLGGTTPGWRVLN